MQRLSIFIFLLIFCFAGKAQQNYFIYLQTDNRQPFYVKIDKEKNKVRSKEVDVSTPDSKVRILVIPTNEEIVIARDTLALVGNTDLWQYKKKNW